MKHAFTKEAKIGLVTIVSLVLLYVGINYLKGVNLFKPVNHYFVTFDNVKNLTISSPVYVEGFKVGLVRDIEYDYSTSGKITVEISLDKEMRITKGSYVTLENSLLSGAELHIHLNNFITEYLNSGSEVDGRLADDMMASIQNDILPSVAEMLPKIDSILVGLQTVVNHPALTQSLSQVERTTANLEVSTRNLNNLLNKDVPVIVGNLKTITDNFTTVSENLKDLDLESTLRGVNATLANLKMTTEKLNSPDSSLGLLLNDRLLYDNLNNVTENASTLLIDLQKNPKRYVRFSVF